MSLAFYLNVFDSNKPGLYSIDTGYCHIHSFDFEQMKSLKLKLYFSIYLNYQGDKCGLLILTTYLLRLFE